MTELDSVESSDNFNISKGSIVTASVQEALGYKAKVVWYVSTVIVLLHIYNKLLGVGLPI